MIGISVHITNLIFNKTNKSIACISYYQSRKWKEQKSRVGNNMNLGVRNDMYVKDMFFFSAVIKVPRQKKYMNAEGFLWHHGISFGIVINKKVFL